jgi:phage virion morphogenesis protein
VTAADPLAPVEAWLAHALAALEPGARRALFGDIGRELRKRNQKRMSRQTGPEGKPWRARKPNKHGRVRAAVKMMRGLREARRMTMKAAPGGVEIGYSGRLGRIASVHHFGSVDAVTKGGPLVKYAARPLLGAAPEDVAYVRERIMAALDPAR